MKNESRYSIRFTAEYVLVEIEGMLSGEEVIAASTEILHSSQFTYGDPQIWDASGADLSNIDGDTAEEVAEKLYQQWNPLPDSYVGLVAGREINYSMVALFKEYYDRDHDYVRVFATIPEAEAWLLEKKG